MSWLKHHKSELASASGSEYSIDARRVERTHRPLIQAKLTGERPELVQNVMRSVRRSVSDAFGEPPPMRGMSL
jgi:hypothetical protein